MKRAVRTQVFETNSSSIHNIVIASEEELKMLNLEEMVIIRYGHIVKKDGLKEGDEFYTLNQWLNSDWLETDSTTYTTKHGEKIHIFCQYGTNN